MDPERLADLREGIADNISGCGRVYVDRLREETDAAAQALQRLGVDP